MTEGKYALFIGSGRYARRVKATYFFFHNRGVGALRCGCKGVLGKKRESRDPFNLGQPYLCSNPDLEGLMRVCEHRGGFVGGGGLYKGELPW